MLEVTLKARPKGCWVTDFVEAHPEAQMKVLDCVTLENSKGVHHFFKIIAPLHLIDNLVESIRNDPTLYDIELVTSKTGMIYGSINIRDHTCGFSMPGIYLKSASSLPDRIMEWNILGNNDSVPQLLKQLDGDGVKVEIIRLAAFNGEEVLTGKQELILQMALERGYFENPRKVNLEELAKITGTTPSAMTQLLRKGLKKVLRQYL